jgi:hypothetical protein
MWFGPHMHGALLCRHLPHHPRFARGGILARSQLITAGTDGRAGWRPPRYSFQTYAERWEFKPADAAGRPKHVLAVLSYCMEVPLGDTGAALVHGFNDTSLLLFPATRLPAADHPFWLSPS